MTQQRIGERAADPRAAAVDATRPDTAGPDTSRPDTSRPDTAELDTAELDTAELDTALDAVHRLLTMTEGDRATATLPPPAPGGPIAHLCQAFGLTMFERNVLLLATLLELSPGVDTEFAALNGSDRRPWPTVGLALAILPDAHWQALLPTSPLRAHQLIRLGPGEILTDRALLIQERVLHALMGLHYLEPRLRARLSPVPAPVVLVASHQGIAEQLHDHWAANAGPAHLWCEVADDGLTIAAAAGRDHQVLRLPAHAVPQDAMEVEDFLALWARESRLQPLALVIELDDADPVTTRAATDIARRAAGPVVTCGVNPRAGEDVVRLHARRAGYTERLLQWRTALAGVGVPDGLEHLVARFQLSAATLDAAVRTVEVDLRRSPEADVRERLWASARVQAHPRLEDLAHHLPTTTRWEQLKVPPAAASGLRALLGQARQKAVVDHDWGFAADTPGARGTGCAAVFAGPSGTGKTMAAEVLAGELQLDLYQIDLSAVVSKYIGETEKNLRRVFDAAESAAAVLLFDEADALFGKRTEVKDSHDRHANIEVSYLLQRMESYSGLAILTTNHRDHLDEAFLRRIPFVIEFPFPEAGLREEIWRAVFPPRAPVKDLDMHALAKLSVAGGSIRSIARNAAFLAADSGGPVTMQELRQAAELEYAKLGRSLTPAEVRGWT